MIAHRWRLDIAAVLDETSDLRWAVRVAGHQYLMGLEQEARAKAGQR